MNPQIIDFAFVFSLSASPVLERKKKEIQFLRFYKKHLEQIEARK